MYIKKCTRCGGEEFIIMETLIHHAVLCPRDGDLTVYRAEAGGIGRIYCPECFASYQEEDFEVINLY